MKITPFLLALALVSILFLPTKELRSQNSNAPRSAGELYQLHCRTCHGVDGRSNTRKGRLNHARNLADPAWQDDVSDERIFNSIMNGRSVRGEMPAFGKKITEAEADSLVTYVRNLKK
jgi:mono/diheme cytochrome c family protein